MSMEQKVCVLHACQGKLCVRGRRFYSSLILAVLLLWEIESKGRFGNGYMGQVRPHCHLSFDQATKALGSVLSSPGAGAQTVSIDGLAFSRRS